MDVVDGILAQTLWALGVIGLALAVAAGVWLVAAPHSAMRAAARLNREFSTKWLQRSLDAPRTTEPFLYRHHKVFGPALIVATGFFFWQFFTVFDEGAIASLYEGLLPGVVLEIAAATVTIILVVGNALGALLGFVILLRPSLLKGTEGWANRWVASDKLADTLDRRVGEAEGFTHRYPRRVGAAILLAAAYIAVIALAVS